MCVCVEGQNIFTVHREREKERKGSKDTHMGLPFGPDLVLEPLVCNTIFFLHLEWECSTLWTGNRSLQSVRSTFIMSRYMYNNMISMCFTGRGKHWLFM